MSVAVVAALRVCVDGLVNPMKPTLVWRSTTMRGGWLLRRPGEPFPGAAIHVAAADPLPEQLLAEFTAGRICR